MVSVDLTLATSDVTFGDVSDNPGTVSTDCSQPGGNATVCPVDTLPLLTVDVQEYTAVIDGCGFTMVDPVGTPPKHDFEGCCADPYDLFQPTMTLYVDPSTMFVCGNEVAWVMQNSVTKDGETSVFKSIEVFRFGEDGSVEIRTHYDVPDASDPAAGELFQEYLPGHA